MRKVVVMIFTMCLLLAGLSTLPVLTISMEDPLSAVSPGTRATITVGADQTYTTIAAGITAASAGDIVLVHKGTYNERITISKPLSIIGNGTENTKMLPTGFGNVITINSQWVNISKMTVCTGTVTSGYTAIQVGAGISDARIENCNMSDSYYGYRLQGSSTGLITDILISNCTINRGQYGGYHYYSQNCNITNNTIDHNIRNAVYCYQSDYNSFENNTMNSSGYPYEPLGEAGLYVYYSEQVIIKNNTFENCGVYLRGGGSSDYTTHDFQDNTVNGRDLFYLKSAADQTIPAGAGQVILVSCDNVKVENHNVSNASVGVTLAYSTNCIIANITSDYNYIGLFLFQSNYYYADNCTFESNRECAVYPYQSNYGQLHNSTITNCSNYGVNNFLASDNRYDNNTLKYCGFPYYDQGHFGIQLQSSQRIIFKNNNFTLCGIAIYSSPSLAYWNTHTMINNSANGDPILYIKDTDGATIPSTFGELIIANSDDIILGDQNLAGSSVGANIGFSDNVVIRNCTVSNNYYGITIEASKDSILTNNTYKNCRYGINTQGSGSSKIRRPLIENSSFTDCYYGAYCNNNENATVRNNTFLRSYQGVYLYYSNYCVIRNNTFNDTGESGVRIFAYSTWNKVENNFINRSGRYGLYMTYHVNYNIIRNNSIWNCNDGLYLNGQSNAITMYLIVENNTCRDNGYNINSRYCENGTITRNYLHNGTYGVYMYYSDFQTIHNNTMNDNTYGIYVVGSSTNYQYNHTITNNTFLNNNYAVRLSYAIRAKVENNTCIEGNNYGLYLSSSNDNRFVNNTVFGFNTYGAYIQSGTGNIFYHNAFYDNGGAQSQAYDITTTNKWDNGVHGNWWSNWTSPDANSDAIVDNAYNIATTTVQDLYPLTLYMAEIQAPANLTPYEDVSYSSGFTQKNGSVPLLWTLSSNASWLTLGPGPQISGTANNSQVGSYWVQAIVLNSKMQESSLNVTINVIDVNDPPNITTMPNVNATEDLPYWTNFTVIDIDLPGDTFTWSFKSNESFLSMSAYGNLSGTPVNADVGIYWVNVTVTDGKGGQDDLNFTLNVSNVNDDPQITTLDVLSANQDELYEVDYNATDIDPTNDTLTWSLTTNATWLKMNATTGVLNGTPLAADVGYYWVNVTVKDGVLGEDFSLFNLTVLEVNYLPQITTVDQTTTDEDALYSVQYLATDLNMPNDALVWSLDTNASWLGIGLTGYLSGIPDNEDVGVYYVNVTVDDARGGSDWHYFILTVNNVNDKPLITTPDVKSATEDVLYSVDYDAFDKDPTNDVLTWTLKTNAGFLGIDSASGVLSGTPDNADVGSYWVNVTVSDSPLFDFRNFTLDVLNTNDPPQVVSPVPEVSFPEDTVYTGLNLSSVFVDVDLDTLTFAYLGGVNIAVEILGNSTVKFTPASQWSGLEVITFFANDSLLQANVDINITVTPVNDAPYDPLITLLETEYVQGQDQYIRGNCSDPDIEYGDVLTFTWHFNTSTITKTGQTVNLSLTAGHHKVTLNVSDTGGLSVTEEIDIEVKAPQTPVDPLNRAPLISINEPDEEDEVFRGTLPIAWTATDPDGDLLAIVMEYSADESTWTTITAPGENTGSYNWDISEVDDGAYYLRLTVTDGALSASATSPRFQINNTVITGDDDIEPDDDVVETDTDGDGLDDLWEQDNFGSLDENASGDFDNDGHSNLAEYIADTDPTDPTDYPGKADDDVDPPNGTVDDDPKESFFTSSGFIILIIIAVLVLVVIILVVIFVMMRRKKEAEEGGAIPEPTAGSPSRADMDSDLDLAMEAFMAVEAPQPDAEPSPVDEPLVEEAPLMEDSLPMDEPLPEEAEEPEPVVSEEPPEEIDPDVEEPSPEESPVSEEERMADELSDIFDI